MTVRTNFCAIRLDAELIHYIDHYETMGYQRLHPLLPR